MKNSGRLVLAVCIATCGCCVAGAQCSPAFSNYYGDVIAFNGGGSDNYHPLWNLTSGCNNTAAGYEPLYNTTSGNDNSGFGFEALYSNTTGSDNSAIGYEALYANSTGEYNTALGSYALSSDTGSNNTATGDFALNENTTGVANTAMGMDALYSETDGSNDTAFGFHALYYDTTGTLNVGVGYQAGEQITTGGNNIDVGYFAGYMAPADSSYNIEIGNYGSSGDDGVTRIGSPGSQAAFYAAGIYGANVSGVPVYVTSSGQLGVENSSLRFKKEVRDMAGASDGLYRLRPVTYRYKKAFADGSDPVEYGLIAEEVAKIYPDLVAYDRNGKIQTVEYQKLVPMMLNELQKQHHLLEKQQAEIQQLEKETAALPMLERRLAAVEAAQLPAARLEARLRTNQP
jgi:hypothetical protein